MALLPMAALALATLPWLPTVAPVFEDDAQSGLTIQVPDDKIVHVELVEDHTEAVADWFIALADLVRKRQMETTGEWMAEDFQGHGWMPLQVTETSAGLMQTEKVVWDASHAPIVDGSQWLAGLGQVLSPWQRIDRVLFKVKAADFQRGRRTWGKAKIYIAMQGINADRNPVSIEGYAYVNVRMERNRWLLERWKLTSLDQTTRSGGEFFANVSESAGVAHQAPRFGTGGNVSYEWNGAAGADVDGDGDWDLFVPGNDRNFLYIAQPDGTYREEAETRGVLGTGGGTGVVFFDLDNDGDQDLLLGGVSSLANDGGLAGRPMRVWLNDGQGKFAAQPAFPGTEVPMVAYHASVADFDNDGWLDVFWACYGRLEVEHNNSWIEATNGNRNVLLRNREGKGFEDVTDRAGVGGRAWTYASAVADVNRDGWMDIYVANDYGNNRLWLNQKDGTYVDQGEALGVADRGNGMGAAFGDLNSDGLLDLYVSNMSSTAGNRILDRLGDQLPEEIFQALKKMAAGNTIFMARPDGGFDTLPSSAGGTNGNWAWSMALNDFNLDGHLDIFCTNGFVTGVLADDT